MQAESEIKQTNIEQSEEQDQEVKTKKIGARVVSLVFILGTIGQVAWAIENSWFNTFVYDVITPNPGPVAWMVAISAATATITTLFMGALSDRTRFKMGRRKPFILFGYILWGVVTAIFPTIAFIQTIGIAVFMVVFVDAVMTFFGSTANDAAYNAWLNDVSDKTNRNRLMGYNTVTTLIANGVAIGLAGIIIDNFGYDIFFYIMGGSVVLFGLIGGLLIKEPPIEIRNKEIDEKTGKSFLHDLIEIFKPKNIKGNKILYLLFINMALTGIATQIVLPYIFIYFEYNQDFSKTMISLFGAIVLGVSAIASIIVGFLGNKLNRKIFLIVSVIFNSVTLLILFFMTNIYLIGTFYVINMAISMSSTVIHTAWLQDSYPKGEIGKYQGVRLVFMVALPMIIGAPIGSAIIKTYGEYALFPDTLQYGYIPSNHIFLYSAIVMILAIIPLFFLKNYKGTLEQIEKLEGN